MVSTSRPCRCPHLSLPCQILRVQSQMGTKRIDISPDENCFSLMKKVSSSFWSAGCSHFSATQSQIQKAFELPRMDMFQAYLNREKSRRIVGVERTLVSDHALKHGDVIFVDLVEENGTVRNQEPEVVISSGSSCKPTLEEVKRLFRWNDDVSRSEDEVDVKLWSMSGQIDRPRDEKLCRHGPNAKCLHCTPLEPYDEGYLKEHKIKHMSFHSYLRRMTRGADR